MKRSSSITRIVGNPHLVSPRSSQQIIGLNRMHRHCNARSASSEKSDIALAASILSRQRTQKSSSVIANIAPNTSMHHRHESHQSVSQASKHGAELSASRSDRMASRPCPQWMGGDRVAVLVLNTVL
jgi:cytoskeletal protein RodZ